MLLSWDSCVIGFKIRSQFLDVAPLPLGSGDFQNLPTGPQCPRWRKVGVGGCNEDGKVRISLSWSTKVKGEGKTAACTGYAPTLGLAHLSFGKPAGSSQTKR